MCASVPAQRPSFGAIGAAPGIRNPIVVSNALRVEADHGPGLLGRVPPRLLVGEGARTWAAARMMDLGQHGMPAKDTRWSLGEVSVDQTL